MPAVIRRGRSQRRRPVVCGCGGRVCLLHPSDREILPRKRCRGAEWCLFYDSDRPVCLVDWHRSGFTRCHPGQGWYGGCVLRQQQYDHAICFTVVITVAQNIHHRSILVKSLAHPVSGCLLHGCVQLPADGGTEGYCR